jgi:hypothetical protein
MGYPFLFLYVCVNLVETQNFASLARTNNHSIITSFANPIALNRIANRAVLSAL